MGFYDNYLSRVNSVPRWAKNVLDNQVERSLRTIEGICNLAAETSVLEVGIGAGVFFQACRRRGWSYTGVDRNASMVSGLDDADAICGQVPPFPEEVLKKRFNLIYSAFVLEHMRDGVQACEFMAACTKCLSAEGQIVILVPDALTLKTEFWSVDYTHTFPTTERNVTLEIPTAWNDPVGTYTIKVLDVASGGTISVNFQLKTAKK